MISNPDKTFVEFSKSLAEGAKKNPIIGEYKEVVPLINEEVFAHQDIINVDYKSHFAQPDPIRYHEGIEQQGKIIQNSIPPAVVQPLISQNSGINVERHDPLFYGVNPPPVPPPVIPERQPAPIPHQRGRFNRQLSVPWWVLLIAFLACLLIFGLLISWMLQRRRNRLAQTTIVKTETTNVTPITPVTPITSIKTTAAVTPITPIAPVTVENKLIEPIKQVKIVEKVQTKTPIVEDTTTKQQTTKIVQKKVIPTQTGVVQEKTIKQIPVSTPAVSPIVIPLVEKQQKDKVQKIVGLICPKNSFAFNNRCYSCPNGQEWNGSNCVIKELKHLKRFK